MSHVQKNVPEEFLLQQIGCFCLMQKWTGLAYSMLEIETEVKVGKATALMALHLRPMKMC